MFICESGTLTACLLVSDMNFTGAINQELMHGI